MKQLLASTMACFALSCAVGCFSKEKTAQPKLSDVQEARIGISDKISSPDPRQAKGLSAENLSQMLFEGLTGVDQKGNIVPGVAETIQVSDDMKTYTFQIRDAKWSNGDPVTAEDFVYSWKSQLHPETKSPTNYKLFVIKGARDAAHGQASLDDVAIQAPDDKTLVVTLENPTPYFLQLAATSTYYPLNKKWCEAHPDWQENGQVACVSNGPFMLSSWKNNEEIELKKNENYWRQEAVRLAKINLFLLDDMALTTLFEQEKLDWIGAPVSQVTKDAYAPLKANGTFTTAPAAGTQFLRVNVEKGPFTNAKMRRAFCLAIDNQEIINNAMQGTQQVATNFLPPALSLSTKEYYTPHDVQGARQAFDDALQEMQISREHLPPVTLTYLTSERADQMAHLLAQNWKDALDVDVSLEPLNNFAFYKKIFSKDYTLAAGSWFADYFDPMSFLSVFQYKENGTNNTEWSNPQYTRLLEESCLEINPQKRNSLLQQAQDILMEELPVIPLFYYSFNFAKSPQLQTELSPLGCMQLNEAYMIQAPMPS